MKLMSLQSYHIKGVGICVYIIRKGISSIVVGARTIQCGRSQWPCHRIKNKVMCKQTNFSASTSFYSVKTTSFTHSSYLAWGHPEVAFVSRKTGPPGHCLVASLAHCGHGSCCGPFCICCHHCFCVSLLPRLRLAPVEGELGDGLAPGLATVSILGLILDTNEDMVWSPFAGSPLT